MSAGHVLGDRRAHACRPRGSRSARATWTATAREDRARAVEPAVNGDGERRWGRGTGWCQVKLLRNVSWALWPLVSDLSPIPISSTIPRRTLSTAVEEPLGARYQKFRPTWNGPVSWRCLRAAVRGGAGPDAVHGVERVRGRGPHDPPRQLLALGGRERLQQRGRGVADAHSDRGKAEEVLEAGAAIRAVGVRAARPRAA